MKPRGTKRKISANQRQQLLQIYLHMGREESRRVGPEYGVSAQYAEKHASDIGKMSKRNFGGGGKIAARIDHQDPRWAWAIQRGGVGI